jgi:hypothetical protein
MSPSVAMRIDKFEAMPGFTMKVTATMPMLDLSGIEFDKEGMIKIGKKEIIRTLQGDVNFYKLKSIKARYIYSYFDSKQNHLYDVEIAPEEYMATLPPETDEEILEGIMEGAKLEMKSVKRQLPIDYDNGFTLRSCDLSENEKIYDYVFLLSGDTEKYARSDKNSFREESQQGIRTMLNNDPATKLLLKYGMSFRYTYMDNEGDMICTFTINNGTK